MNAWRKLRQNTGTSISRQNGLFFHDVSSPITILFFNRKECRAEMSQLQERNSKLKIQLEDTINKVFILYILTLTSIYFRAITLFDLHRNKHTSVVYLNSYAWWSLYPMTLIHRTLNCILYRPSESLCELSSKNITIPMISYIKYICIIGRAQYRKYKIIRRFEVQYLYSISIVFCILTWMHTCRRKIDS